MMKYTEKNKMGKINPKIWENSFYWQYGAYPFFTSVYLKTAENTNKNYFVRWDYFINYFSNGIMDGYEPKHDFLVSGNRTIGELINGKKDFLNTFKSVHKEITRAIKICSKLVKDDKSSSFGKWWPLVERTLSNSSCLIFAFDFTLEEFLKDMKVKYPEDFNVINSHIFSRKPSFIDKANEELVELDKKYSGDFKKVYTKFIKDFGWLQNSYKGRFELDGEWVKSHLNQLKIINKKTKIKNNISVPLPKKYKLLVGAARFGITFRDDKKKLLLIAVDLMEKWLRNTSRENNWEFDYMRWLSVDEVLDAIYGDKDIVERAKKYQLENERCGIMTSHGFDDVDISLWKKVIELQSNGYAKEITGLPANNGNIRGTVKIIINPFKERDKFKNGDILVTAMTRPEFLPLMKQASAIITDEGGITCHAAIVSRELNIPCIIGTKFATKVLKDGDLVEVDANNGIIKIIK